MGRAEELKEHSTFAVKVRLRQWLYGHCGGAAARVLETHGGEGRLWQAGPQPGHGVVCEIDPTRCGWLERQRPTWRVVCGDARHLLGEGLAADDTFDVLDCDPYTQPWPVLEAFFGGGRTYAPRMGVVVTDPLRQGVRYDNGRRIKGLQPYVVRYGRHLHRLYLQVCKERLGDLVAPCGYRIRAWQGQYGGQILTMSYYSALLERDGH